MNINGIPITAIILPTGNGITQACEIMSAARVIPAPQNNVIHNTLRCTELPMTHLAA